ncbi:hypothetical protein CTH30272_03061 [Allocatenococcus thiocycli]|nr:hypothetical protein CTH30272_03061 [Catenococcus thiocycli]
MEPNVKKLQQEKLDLLISATRIVTPAIKEALRLRFIERHNNLQATILAGASSDSTVHRAAKSVIKANEIFEKLETYKTVKLKIQ